ncbi:hypothetical protein [Candidatus Tisiphia endosymbiont of Nemotelus uliginosus]|uniref:hypothetical protein n=1 Tax=Candidatus Tisiphia endosymbiont of Nemotelus uliginosus TaxID=3077926 RepID=UPI0035C909D1
MSNSESNITIEEYNQAKAAYHNLKAYKSNVEAVIEREKADRGDEYRTSDKDLGESHSTALLGYKALIEGYIASTPEALDPKLADMLYPIAMMADQDNVLYRDRDFNKQASILVQDIEDPNKSNTTYIRYTNTLDQESSHANIIKYSKEDNIYYRTIYNAGFKVNTDNEKLDKVKAVILSTVRNLYSF